MNLYFRVLLTLLKNIFTRNKSSVIDKMVWRGRVLLNDIDVFGHMNNGRYLTLMGLALFDAGIKSGNFLSTLKYKYIYLFSDTDIQWIKPLKLFERFSIESQLMYWEENKGYTEVKFVNQKNQIVAKANYKVVLKSPIRKGVIWRDLMNDNTFGTSPIPKPQFVERLDENMTF